MGERPLAGIRVNCIFEAAKKFGAGPPPPPTLAAFFPEICTEIENNFEILLSEPRANIGKRFTMQYKRLNPSPKKDFKLDQIK
jgi:hypothetical protein